jgi:hypothetical protein
VGFVMCGCFGNMRNCIYCVLYCFVDVYLFLFVLSVLGLLLPSDNSIAANNNNNNNNNNKLKHHVSEAGFASVFRHKATNLLDPLVICLSLVVVL